MIGWFVVHAFVYVGVCALLTAIWVLTSGSAGDLSDMLDRPELVRTFGFWPVWVYVTWGSAVVAHLALVLALRHRRAQRRRRRRREHRRAVGDGARTSRPTTAPGGRAQGRRGRPPARRWVTVLFTDVVGSTALAEQVGDEAWSSMLSEHRRLVRRVLSPLGGEVLGTQGDGCLARFPSPAAAVAGAAALQREVAAARHEHGSAVRIRVGIHAGDVVEDDGDLVGRVVNIAARVTALAGADEVLVTEPVADGAGAAFAFDDRGLHELRGVPRPRHLLSLRSS